MCCMQKASLPAMLCAVLSLVVLAVNLTQALPPFEIRSASSRPSEATEKWLEKIQLKSYGKFHNLTYSLNLCSRHSINIINAI